MGRRQRSDAAACVVAFDEIILTTALTLDGPRARLPSGRCQPPSMTGW